MRLPARLLKRDRESHKGDFGHVLVLAGSGRYAGAACLCSLAVLRAGAGMVTLGVAQGLYPVVAARNCEVMTVALPGTKSRSLSARALGDILKLLGEADCLLMGPGLSLHPETQDLVRRVLKASRVPVVLDADALSALAGHLDVLKGPEDRPLILTPHPGEMARLTGFSVRQIQAARKKVAKDFSLRYNVTLVLKGHRTVVASPGKTPYVNTTGNPGMATAGSGDVLSGVIAGFLAQGLSAFEAAKYGVYAHGRAGDLAAAAKTEIGLIASDIIVYLPDAFKPLN